jgi:hypothetical protein
MRLTGQEISYASAVKGWHDLYWWMARDFVRFHRFGRGMTYSLDWRGR